MWPDLSHRSTELEWMDHQELSDSELKEVLGFLTLTNRYFGGCRTILSVLGQWEKFWQKGDTIHFLDVGTGGADIPIAIHRWTARRGYRVHITGVDKAPGIVEFARRRVARFKNINICQADIFEWAAKGHSYDYVIGSLFLHHVPEVQIPGLLKCWDRMARRGLIVSDLVRSPWAYWAVWLLSRLAGNKIVQSDGPLSVCRAFSKEDLEGYRRLSGLPYLEIRHHPGFRWTLAGEKGNLIVQKTAREAKIPVGRVSFSPGLSAKGSH